MTYRRNSTSTLILAMSIVMASQAALGAGKYPKPHLPTNGMHEVFKGRVLVKVNGADSQDGRPAHITPLQRSRFSTKLKGGIFVAGLHHGGWTVWDTPNLPNAHLAVEALKTDPDVICVQPLNRVYPVTLPVPNDPDWSYVETSSTYVLDFGSSSSGTKGFRRLWNLWDTNAVTDDTGGVLSGGWALYPGTWYTSKTKPADCPIIAFVDTGLDMDHPDFINAGGSSSDSANGGQIMKALSAFIQNGAVVPNGDPTDQVGHGTHVTGIALASGNNGSFGGDGVIGIGYNSRGMVLRVFDNQGNASDADAAAAIYYAADNGAAIINCSIGTGNYSQVFQDAVTYAFQKGSLVVASGNENGKGGGNLGPIYPAACSGALAVTANAPGLYPADDYYAGYGNYVGLAAPGGDYVILSTTSSKLQYVYSTATRYPCQLSQDPNVIPAYTLNYTYLVGTSMACPHVSGAAGLYYGQNGMHQSDGFANLRAFQALEISAMGTAGAINGGWEPTQGYGSLDVQGLLQLSTQANPRQATVGDVTGIVYFGGTPTPNVRVTATQVASPFKVYATTTFADGTYRFDAFPAGIYDISASPFNSTKTKRVQVTNGCDMPGVDFFTGPKITDSTPPKIVRFNFLGATNSTLDFDQWAYDTETEIDSATIQVGTTSGASDILAPQVILPGSTRVHLDGLALPTQYFATVTYTNGIGSVSKGVRALQTSASDAFVTDATPKTDYLLPHIDVKTGRTRTNAVTYLGIDLTGLGANIQDARLTLTGSAVGAPVPIGVYGTSNPTWSEKTLTWYNAPKISGSVVDEQTVGALGTYTWNIASLVQAAKKAQATTLTLAIKCDTFSLKGASFKSHRASSGAPILVSTSND